MVIDPSSNTEQIKNRLALWWISPSQQSEWDFHTQSVHNIHNLGRLYIISHFC